MTALEAAIAIREGTQRVHVTGAAVVSVARSLVPALKDAKLDHQATELDRVLFEHDAAVQEVLKLMEDNVELLLEAYLKRGGA